jgi:nitrite reductase/ring-hydroxylating ferredoxin subunit
MSEQLVSDQTKFKFVLVGKAAECPPGERILFEIDGLPLALFNVGDKYYAIDDVCTHDDGPVGEGDLDGFTIVCPRHGAHFDIRSGKALALPAVMDIQIYPVKVTDGNLYIGIPV